MIIYASHFSLSLKKIVKSRCCDVCWGGYRTETSFLSVLCCTDVLETAEEAETQADLPDDAEPLTEPQRKENVGNSTATGENDLHTYYRPKVKIQTIVITHKNTEIQIKNIFNKKDLLM